MSMDGLALVDEVMGTNDIQRVSCMTDTHREAEVPLTFLVPVERRRRVTKGRVGPQGPP